jgi:hypothetical protein
MNAQPNTTSAAARWRWTCAALAAAASLGASVDAPAESAAVVTVSAGGAGASRSGQPGGSAGVRINFQVVIPPRMELDSSKGLKATSNLEGKVQTTVDHSGEVPVHTVSIP